VRRDPPASEVTGVPGADDHDDKTVPIRTAGPDAASPPALAPEQPPGSPQPAQPPQPAEPGPSGPSGPPPRRAAGRLFGAVTVVPALLAAAWLLPGLPLLLAGRISAPPLVFMFSPLAVGLCYFALRQQPAAWPGFRGDAKTVPWWAVAATAAVAAGFAVWQIAERSQQVIVLRDPAAYLQVASWIARHGSLPIPPQADAFGGAHPGLTFASAGYYPAGAGLVPQFMTGLPLVLAAAIWLGGVPAALVLNPLIGACAVLSFGGLAARLIGARWAPVAAAALALSLPEQYTSRGTFGEPLAQVLLFGGLCLLIDALVVTRQPAAAPAAGAAPEPGRDDWPGQDQVLAALAGLTLGLVVLVRIDGLSDILPAVPFLGLMLAARRRQGVPFGLGLVAGAGYGLADGYLKARPYLDLVGPSLRPLGLIAAAVVLLTLAGLAVAHPPAALARLRGWLSLRRPAARRLAGWLPWAAAALTVAAFAAFALRPLAHHAPGQYDQDSLYWVIWYIGLPAVLLGAFGLAVLAQRAGRALLTWGDDPPKPPREGMTWGDAPPKPPREGMTWGDPDAEARTWALPLLIALWVIVTVLWRPAISADQPWASRRLVPFVLPGLILAAVWASAWLRELAGQRGRARTISGVVASCCAASLLIPAAMTNLDLGYTSGPGRHLSARGMAFQRIAVGELAAVNALCAAIGPDASVVILDQGTADSFAQDSRDLCDTPTAVLDHPTPAAVAGVTAGIVRAGRRPVLLGQDAAELAPYGSAPRQVVSLLTTQDARELTAPPTRAWPIQYTVWMSLARGDT
jgi:hypothetical protein